MKRGLITILLMAGLMVAPVWADETNISMGLTAGKITIPTPTTYEKLPWRTFYYKVEARGEPEADFEDFKVKAAETLTDARGWVRGGYHFVQLSEAGEVLDANLQPVYDETGAVTYAEADFTLYLSESSTFSEYDFLCSTKVSCTYEDMVMINDARWRTSNDGWILGLRNYQHTVVNHEVGHWLGHHHDDTCAGKGQPALILATHAAEPEGGCIQNAWPLDSELWTTK